MPDIQLFLIFLTHPLEGGMRFGDKGGGTDPQARHLSTHLLSQSAYSFYQPDDIGDILGCLGGQAEHEVQF